MRKRLTYANVAATMALVFSMSGGALAANHYLISSTKQINPKVLKKLRGKTGATGAKGATGATGAPGAAGKEGAPGKEGPAGPLLTVVPSGHTIAGTYGVFASSAAAKGDFVGATVSYPLELPALPTAVFVAESATEPTHCGGSVSTPAAKPGFLCIYRGDSFNVSVTPVIANLEGQRNGQGNRFGFVVEDEAQAAGTYLDEGTWAYTAP